MRATTALLLAAGLLAGPVAAMDFNPAGTRFNVPLSSMKELRFQGTLRQQYDFSCGSAALATLLSFHYGRQMSERAVFESMFAAGDQQKIRREGFSLLDMKRFLATLGYRADGFKQSLDKLAEAGLPAIVLVSINGYHHFVVVKGVAGDRVLVGDPAMGTSAMPRARFEKIWTNGLLFVIYGAAAPPVFNAAADWRAAPRLLPADGLDRRGLDLLTMPKLGPGDF